jgi:hypothetical protein
MSSLQEILQQHSQSITNNLSHANDIATANVDRKANDLEEKFQHVKDSVEGAGGDLVALGGAYHLGRKVIKKVRAAKQAAQAIQGSGEEPGDDIKIDLPEGSSESGGTQSSRPQVGDAETTDPEAHTTEDAPQAGQASGDTEPVQPEQTEAPESGGGGGEADTTFGQNVGRQQAVDAATKGEFPERPSGQPSGDLAKNVGTPDEEGGRQVASLADEVGDAGAEEAGSVGETLGRTAAETLGKGTSSLVVNNADTATQAASKLAGLGGDAVSAGLDTASAVLDALGPVGEVAGVITSLVGLFEGLGHKKKDVEETGQEAGADTPVSTAIDPKALMATTM